jgi:serine protease
MKSHLKNLAIAAMVGILTGFVPTSLLADPGDKKINLSALQQEQLYQRFIVGLGAISPGDPGRLANLLTDVAKGQGVGLQYLRQLATGAIVVEASEALPANAAIGLMRVFAKRAEVEYIEPDALMRPMFTPIDEYYGSQWHYHEATAGLNLPAAWDVATGAGVVVAVLDTGQTNHADLFANFVAGYDFIWDSFVSRDGDGRDWDPRDEGDWNAVMSECYGGSPVTTSSWHGTHVAGTIAALTNNGTGAAGVAFNAMVQHLRVLGRCGGYLSDIADAIVWASGGKVTGTADNNTPARVINMSLGGGGSCGSTYQNAINTAVGNGTTVVVSAGNSNSDASGSRPANCNNVITVAASDRQGNRAFYSNYGPLVEITAPGGETSTRSNGVRSTLNSGSTVQGSDSYAYYQGTSMAAPHITGLAALMYSVNPALTPAEVSQLIMDNARPLAGSCSGGCGAGLADAGATLQAVAGLGGPIAPPNEVPTAGFTYNCSDLVCNFTDQSTDNDGSIASRSWEFGNSGTSGETNPSHTFEGTGGYTVLLTVIDDMGAEDSYSELLSVTATETGSSQPPAAPTNLVADAQTQGKRKNRTVVSLTLYWTDNASNELGFQIESCLETGKGRNKSCGNIRQVSIPPDSNQWSETELESGRIYRVRAFNGNGDSQWSNSVKS